MVFQSISEYAGRAGELTVHGLSIVTPPKINESIIERAGKLGIKHGWIHPETESDAAIQRANKFGMNLIAGGPCLLVTWLPRIEPRNTRKCFDAGNETHSRPAAGFRLSKAFESELPCIQCLPWFHLIASLTQ